MISKEEVNIALEAYSKNGTIKKAAEALGVSFGWVQRRLAKASTEELVGDTPEIHGLDVTGITYLEKDGVLQPKWLKATMSAQGKKALFDALASSVLDRIPPAAPVKWEAGPRQPDLMNFIPIGDLHLGMMAWAQETGDGDWDLKIGKDVYHKAIYSLINSAPEAHTCVIAPMGDFLHFDGHFPLTPASKNLLDTDTRFPKMVHAAMDCIEYAIYQALRRFPNVHLIIELGNHDPASAVWLREAFARIYRDEERVTVDTSPAEFHYFLWGKTLLGTNHGHKVKLAKLPGIMAVDKKEWWGQTDFRYWWTGHIHHDTAKDLDGTKIESVRVLPPLDSYAATHGYRGERDLKLITYSKDWGEVARYTVNAQMFDG